MATERLLTGPSTEGPTGRGTLLAPHHIVFVYLIAVAAVVVGLALTGRLHSVGPLLLLTTGLFFLVFGLGVIEIRTPHVGLLYRFGALAVVLRPGWYFVLRPVESIETVSLESLVIADRSTRLSASFSRVQIGWRARFAVDPGGLQQYIRTRGVSLEFVWSAVWSAVTTAIGHLQIENWRDPTLLRKLQEEVTRACHQKLSGSGFQLEDVEITEAGDILADEAQEIMIRGRAQAAAVHELALKTEPVRGDFAHALAFVGAVLAQMFQRAKRHG